jgi:hypothetical protein
MNVTENDEIELLAGDLLHARTQLAIDPVEKVME